MTMFYYIGANHSLPMGSYGEKYTLKKLKDIPKLSDPNDLCNLLDLSHLENEWTEGEFIEIYSCWADEEELPIRDEGTINLSSYKLGESFEIKERQLIRFVWET